MPQANQANSGQPKPSKMTAFSSGKPDNFDGTITGAVLAPWKYPNAKWTSCYALLEITPDEDSDLEKFVEPYDFANLPFTLPSNDGETPTIDKDFARSLAAGDDALGEGEHEQYQGTDYVGSGPTQNKQWYVFVKSLEKLGWALADQPNSIDGYIGLRAHFDRLAPTADVQKPKKSADPTKEPFKILQCTEIYSKPGEKGSSKGKSSSSSSTTSAGKATTKVNGSASASSSDLESRVRDVLVEALRTGAIKLDDSGSVKKDSAILRGKVTTLGKFNKDGQLKPTVNLLNDDAFHEANAEMGLYLYDSETGEITPLEE